MGARRGEVCALKWSGFDDKDGSISIDGSVSRVVGSPTITAPKTASSRRKVYLDGQTAELLRQHRRQQSEHILKMGGAVADNGLIFPNAAGGILSPDVLTTAWAALCREAGVKHRLHDLRHHYAPALLAGGESVITTVAALGHSTRTMTLNIYSHVIEGAGRKAADTFAAAMSGG